MNFSNAIDNQRSLTENGMAAHASSGSACLDLFYGATRGVNIVPKFVAALAENHELALRIALWIRDARGGSGERQLFRDILSYLQDVSVQDTVTLLNKASALGRWDDLLGLKNPVVKGHAFALIADALYHKNQLCAKWLPRKGVEAAELRSFLRLTPKQYRKLLVGLTNVVETQMCAKEWESINFSHVPSLAHARYKSAFSRNSSAYATYVEALRNGDSAVKVNAGAVYPYDVIKGFYSGLTADKRTVMEAQWASLPNYVGAASVLPMIDVSGSMKCSAGNTGSLSCLDVAVSLGMYFADKNTGEFKDCFLTFSSAPELQKLSGTISQKLDQLRTADWGMSTNLNSALDIVLKTALDNQVPNEEMPKTLIIFSDMQFNECTENSGDTALEMMKKKYEVAGYSMPAVVFWNLNARYDNTPAKKSSTGVALVSGFSPAVASAILTAGVDELSPEKMMLRAVMVDRYNLA